jgi:hypothetical protein
MNTNFNISSFEKNIASYSGCRGMISQFRYEWIIPRQFTFPEVTVDPILHLLSTIAAREEKGKREERRRKKIVVMIVVALCMVIMIQRSQQKNGGMLV